MQTILDTTQLVGVIAIIVSGALTVTRLLRVLTPLHGWLPPKAQWAPGAISGAAGVLAARLPSVTDWVGFAEVVLEAAVLAALAAAAGLHAPDAASPKPPVPPTLVLLVLLVGVGIAGCAPTLEQSRDVASVRLTRDVAAGEPAYRDSKHCARLANTERALRYVAVGAAVVGGGGGLATIPVEDKARPAVAGTAGVLEAERIEVARDWAEDCAQ